LSVNIRNIAFVLNVAPIVNIIAIKTYQIDFNGFQLEASPGGSGIYAVGKIIGPAFILNMNRILNSRSSWNVPGQANGNSFQT
jgi:hypothetical protein